MNTVLIGQYSYTACETPGPYSSVPGWKVKQVRAALPFAELPEAAVKAAVRPFGRYRTPAIGPLTTQAEIDQLPRCLRLDQLPDGSRSLAHLAAAGRDRSGRDAFFAHGLLIAPPEPRGGVAAGDQWSRYRPADFWGAQGWLTPYRADAIEAATLGDPPQLSPASPLDPDRRLDFVELHPGQREFVLAAAERALTTGVPLVVVGMPVAAAMWTSLITHFLLSSVGWSMTFSTYEAGAADEVVRAGSPAVVGVPPANADAWHQVPGDVATVHDPGVPAERTPSGYLLGDGTPLPIGPWAQLAEVVCRLGWEDRVRGSIDRLGEQVGAGLDRWPLFALPAVVLTMPDDVLHHQPELARRAADAAAQGFPLASTLPGPFLNRLVEATVRWGAAPLRTTYHILTALDEAGGRPPTDVVDPVVEAYIRELLKPHVLQPGAVPWLPGTAGLSRAALSRLADDLPQTVQWLDDVGSDEARAALILAVAAFVDRVGLTGEETMPALRAALSDRARRALVPAMLGGDGAAVTRSAVAGWPPIPPWLWHEVLLDALTERLDDLSPGAVLADPAVGRLVAQVAGPLPQVYVPGRTLNDLSLVDGERAAGLVRAGLDGSVSPEQRVVIGAAAFLRCTLTGQGRLRVDPSMLTAEFRRCFGEVSPGPAVLRDLLEQLRDAVPVERLGEFAASLLASSVPDEATASIVTGLSGQGLPAPYTSTGPLAWHRQFSIRPPMSPLLPNAPRSRPDAPETRLLEAVAFDRLEPGLMKAGLDRMAVWIVVLPAEFLDLPGNPARTESLRWVAAAAREPLAPQLRRMYQPVARWLVKENNSARTKPPVAADALAAEWVVRAGLATLGIGGDPASILFTAEGGSAWQQQARLLLRPTERPPQEMENWLNRVRLSAENLARVAYPGVSIEVAGDGRTLIDTAMDRAAALAGLSGASNWFRRTSPTRRS